jgi:hypothetical protein
VASGGVDRRTRIIPLLTERSPLPVRRSCRRYQLAIWKHLKPQRCTAPVNSDQPPGCRLFSRNRQRDDILDTGLYVTDPHLHILADALRTGRSFPTGHLWGILEKRLGELTTTIWDNIFSNSQPDIPQILQDHIQTITQRLRVAIG